MVCKCQSDSSKLPSHVVPHGTFLPLPSAPYPPAPPLPSNLTANPSPMGNVVHHPQKPLELRLRRPPPKTHLRALSRLGKTAPLPAQPMVPLSHRRRRSNQIPQNGPLMWSLCSLHRQSTSPQRTTGAENEDEGYPAAG